jgi:hypothetical protein
MNIREIFEGKDPQLKHNYSYVINRYARDRAYQKDGTIEDHAIKKITDIYFYKPQSISVKQMDWVIRYATKFRIEYPITSAQKVVSSTNSAIEEIKI